VTDAVYHHTLECQESYHMKKARENSKPFIQSHLAFLFRDTWPFSSIICMFYCPSVHCLLVCI